MRSATIGEWLAAEGLPEYTELFEKNRIGPDVLSELNERDLQDLGIPLGDRKRLLKALRYSLQPTHTDGTPLSDLPAGTLGSERRQLTVLFCDLAGSTALATQLDPEQLRDLMQAYQQACGQVIARFDGHVAQYLGDGLMVYFGWPRAHEDDAARAIRAGLEMMQAVSNLTASTPIKARIGIHTGLVVVGETGHGDASIPKAAVGETPNIAARLRGLAEPGNVVISERTRGLAGELYDYVDLGTPSLKGISEPLRVFRVAGSRAIESRFEATRSGSGLTPLVGREEEIALLLRRWEQAKEHEGQVVLIGGEAGIGKSRLTRALRERLDQEPLLVLRYQCSPLHVNSPLYPALEQLQRSAGFTREDSTEQKLDKLEAVLAGDKQQVLEAAPLLAMLLSLPGERYGVSSLSPQKQKERTLEALARQIECRAQHRPLLLIYEDAHWMDATSQEALVLLVPRLRDLPVLAIVTHRPEHSARWTDQAHVTTLGLNRLGRRQGADLVAKVTGGKALPVEVFDQILAHTDGVPLFIEELTKSVLESKLLREENDRYALAAPLPALAIPTTLRDSLLARLDRLAPVREVAQIGACIGREFSYELLAAVAVLPEERIDDALEQLSKTGLVFRRGTPPEATYTFKHALVQDAAYDSLLRSKRTELHAKIAAELEARRSGMQSPEVLARHLTQAELHERAVPYWIQAGQRALARVALSEAVAHFTMALTVNGRTPASSEHDHRELDIRLLLTAAYLASVGWAAVQVLQTLGPARELAIRCGQDDKLISVLVFTSMHHNMRLEFSRTLELVGELDALARTRQDSSTVVLARWNEAWVQCAMGNFKRAQQVMDVLLRVYDSEKHRCLADTYNIDPMCDILIWAGYWLWALGYPDQARQAVEKGLELARRIGQHALNLCWSLTGGTYALVLRGEQDLARQWVAEALTRAKEHGMTFVGETMVPWANGLALIAQGDYAEGYAQAEVGLRRWRAGGGLHTMPFGNMILGMALVGLKRFDEARSLLEESLELSQRTGHRIAEAETYRALGELHQQPPTSNPDAAEAFFLKALDVARSQEAKGFELRAAISLARLWKGQGNRQEAYELLAPVYSWFTKGLNTKDLVEARALLRELV